MKFPSSLNLIIFFSVGFIACKDSKEKTPAPPLLVKKETATNSKTEIPQKGPIINIVDTIEIKRIVLCLKDSSATSVGMSTKLNNIYNKKIPDAISAAKLKRVGQPIAWFKSQKAPFFFEAGIPVDKAPAKIPKGFFIKKIGGDSVLVAHFFGPNVMSNVGYDAVTEMLKERNRKRTAQAYEIYIDNPFEVKKGKTDPYKQQTDIVMPYK